MKKIVFTLISILSINAYAAHECGENLGDNCWDCAATENDKCTARLDNGILTISGSGATRSYSDFSSHPEDANPWAGRDDIQKVIVEEGITSLGGNSFENVKIKEVSLPQSLLSLDWEVFQRTSLEFIVIPDNVTTIGGWMFSDSPIKGIVIGQSLNNIQERIGLPNDVVIFCNESDKRSKTCEELISQNNPQYTNNIQPYVINDDGNFVYKNKTYASLADLAKFNHIKKRIYTIDEANTVAGEKNRVSITYR